MSTVLNKGIRFINYKSNTLVVLGILWSSIFLVDGFLIYFGISSYNSAYERLGDQATSYAHLIAAHDRYGFTLADTLLKGVMDFLTPDDFNGAMKPPRRIEVMEHLKRYRARLPGIASFTIIGTDGIRQIGVVGKDGTDLSKRGYFKALRDGQELYITNAEDGLASGKPGIHIARRFPCADGKFCGVVVLNLAVEDVFYPFYQSLNLGKNFAVSLRDSSRMLIRYPRSQAHLYDNKDDYIVVGKDIFSTLKSGRFVGIDPVDRINKLTSYERLEGTPIFATASLPVDEAMSGPHRIAWVTFLAAAASILAGLAATIVIAQTRGLEIARDAAVKSDAEKRKLIQKVDSAVEHERESIAIEIHDQLNATVIGARLNSKRILDLVEHIESSPEKDEIKNCALATINLASVLYANGRNIVRKLRPEALDILGIQGAVAEMMQNYNYAQKSCRFKFNAIGDFSKLDGGLAIASYRLVQEALSNSLKHARASKVAVSLFLDDTERILHIVITDNGVGFDADANHPGIGIVGMRERVFAFNGKIDITSESDIGTTIAIELPISNAFIT